MTDYGDADPFDAWDDTDPLAVRLRLLARLVDALDLGEPAHRLIVRRLAGKVAAELETI